MTPLLAAADSAAALRPVHHERIHRAADTKQTVYSSQRDTLLYERAVAGVTNALSSGASRMAAAHCSMLSVLGSVWPSAASAIANLLDEAGALGLAPAGDKGSDMECSMAAGLRTQSANGKGERRVPALPQVRRDSNRRRSLKGEHCATAARCRGGARALQAAAKASNPPVLFASQSREASGFVDAAQ